MDMAKMSKRKKRALIWGFSAAAVLLAICAAFFIYVSIYYEADEEAIDAFAPMGSALISEDEDGNLLFSPSEGEASCGFIFYPGGKVEHRAYAPLMAALAERGIFSVLIDMPFNLAVFDISAAEGIAERYPEIEDWYIGGHSLGGSMAASYLEDGTGEFSGLVLLGSYSTADLSKSGLRVLSVFGSEDGIMDREKYEECKNNLPSDYVEIIIEGGCHAYFGMYGEQDGDGQAKITPEEQINMTADGILQLVSGE